MNNTVSINRNRKASYAYSAANDDTSADIYETRPMLTLGRVIMGMEQHVLIVSAEHQIDKRHVKYVNKSSKTHYAIRF